MAIKKQMLITGVSGAVGSYLAEHFLKQDFQIFGMDVSNPGPKNCLESKNFTYSQTDLTDSAATTKAIEGYMSKHGAFDVVINNVGLIFNCPLIRFEDGNLLTHGFEEWNKVLSVSLSAAFYVTAVCVKCSVKEQKKSVIINISSICAKGNPGQAAYSAAKAGLNGLTYALAKELGPTGIRVVALAPGFLDTPSTHNAVGADKLKRVIQSVPLKRLGNLSELAHAIEFVAGNSYYNATVLELDGGLSI